MALAGSIYRRPSGLSASQAALFGFALRGRDTKATSFPDANENAAITLNAASCCWVNGLGNNTCCQPSWISHDLSLLMRHRLIGEGCVAGAWPCNPQGLTLQQGQECYDAGCKASRARVFVR